MFSQRDPLKTSYKHHWQGQGQGQEGKDTLEDDAHQGDEEEEVEEEEESPDFGVAGGPTPGRRPLSPGGVVAGRR